MNDFEDISALEEALRAAQEEVDRLEGQLFKRDSEQQGEGAKDALAPMSVPGPEGEAELERARGVLADLQRRYEEAVNR